MGIINPFKKELDKKTVHYRLVVPGNLLIIFTRNPELGKGKRRLAATVGNQAALEIYRFLLAHTAKITENLAVEKHVYYSESIGSDDVWNELIYTKKLQQGEDLGVRMANAFLEGFAAGFEKICIIGSDLYDMEQQDIENAFLALNHNDFVIGPAEDGGYYLLGMKTFTPSLFQDKEWGKRGVLDATLSNLENEDFSVIDYYAQNLDEIEYLK